MSKAARQEQILVMDNEEGLCVEDDPEERDTSYQSVLCRGLDEGLELNVLGGESLAGNFASVKVVQFPPESPTVELEEDSCEEPSQREDLPDDYDEFQRAEDHNVERFMDEFLLESIAVQFHSSVFFIQFLCHMLFPMAYFLINYKAQGFELKYDWFRQPSTFFNLILPTVVYVMVVMYAMCPADEEKVIRGAFWVPCIFFIQHRMTVGLKYASLSPSEYAKFQNVTDSKQADRYAHQMQLLTGWGQRDALLVQFELGCAAARIGAKINEISITIANPSDGENARKEFACWNALLRKESTVRLNSRPAPQLVRHADGTYTLSVYDLCKSIVTKADGSSSKRMKSSIHIFVALMVLVPYWNVIQSELSLRNRSPYLYAFLGCNLVITGFYGTVAFLLLYVSVWDVSRQLHIVRYLHRLIRITDLTLDTSISFHRDKHGKKFKNKTSRDEVKEKLGVILSVTKPERRKSIALRKSQSGDHTAVSNKGYVSYPPSASAGTSGRLNNNASSSNSSGGSSRRRSPSGKSVSSQDIKSRFTEFGTSSVKEEDHSHIPQISFKYAENVIAWTYTRLVFQHFGERFRNRIDMYTGGTMVLMLSLMGALLLMVIVDPHPLVTLNTVFAKQTILTVMMMWGFMLVCASLGALVNSQLNVQSRTFAAHKLRVRDEMLVLTALDEDNDTAIAKLAEVLEVIDDCKDVVETYAELKPFSIFGLKVESSTVFTLLSMGVSFFGILFSLYSTASSNENSGS